MRTLSEKGLDYLINGVAVTDVAGSVLIWNRLLQGFTGIAAQEAVGKPVQELIPYLATPHVQLRIESIVTGGPPAVFSPQLHPEIIRARREDGRPRRFQLHVAMIEEGGQQNIIYIFQELTDHLQRLEEMARLKKRATDELEERRQAEELLALSEQRLRALLDATQDAIFMIDPEGCFLMLNDALANRFGKSEEELLGANAFALVPEPLRSQRMGQIRQVLDSGEPMTTQDERGGIVQENTIYPVRTPGGETVAVAIYSRDITELRRAEAQRIEAEQLRTANRMAATIAHEFNNPLAILKATSEMILSGMVTEPGRMREMVNKIPAHVDRMHALVQRLLDLREVRARDYAGTMKILELPGKDQRQNAIDPAPSERKAGPGTIT